MDPIQRRQLMQQIGAGMGAAGVVSFAGCLNDEDESTGNGSGNEEMHSAPYLLSEDALDMVPFQVGVEQGIWEDHGIDLELEVTGYGQYSQALTTGDPNFGNNDQAMFVDAYLNDYELTAFGSNLVQTNDIFVRPDSDIESPADLEGRSVGVPQWQSGTTLGMRATIQDEYDIALSEDTDGTAADPPVLWELLVEQEEIDAAVQFTGYTIRGYANEDQVRPIFDIANYWEDRTGHPLNVIYFAARNGWLEDNYDVAYRFLQAWEECLEVMSEDPRNAYDRYGLLAGLQDDNEVDVAVDLFEAGQVHELDPSVWDEDYVDAQWEFLDLLAETGVMDDAPPREQGVTYSEIEDYADE